MEQTATVSFMQREIAEIPPAVARLAAPLPQKQLVRIADHLRALDPPAVMTLARGSSDHAASYLKYAIELQLGRPVASMPPSVASVYGAELRCQGLAALAISQSGAGADLGRMAAMLRRGGAHTVALTNRPESALAQAADDVVDIAAGPETAVAATKSFVNSVVAGLWLIAHWSGDHAMQAALTALPDRLAAGTAPPVLGEIAETLLTAERAVVLGRGPGFGLAQEMALKLLETCRIHASAYSGAEVLHGPSALLTEDYPVIALTTGASSGMDQALERLTAQGARVLRLPPAEPPGHLLVDPLVDMPAFYAMVEALSRARGGNPDAPAHLHKETQTL